MRIVDYTKEQLDSGTIVLVKNGWRNPGVFKKYPVKVVKSTAKQIVTQADGLERHMTADKFGVYEWSGIYCLNEDVDKVIEEYKTLKTGELNSKISSLQNELEEVKNLQLLKEEV